jgi:hypothetical protein
MPLRITNDLLEFMGYPVAVLLHSAPPSVQEKFRRLIIETSKKVFVPEPELKKDPNDVQ